MQVKISCSLSEDDFSEDGFHPDNTILVTIEGPGAAKAPLDQLQSFIIAISKNEDIKITTDELQRHYRNEEACRVYFPLPTNFDIRKIHGKTLMKGKLRFTALIPGKEPKKIFLNYVPATINEHGLNTLLKTFIDPRKIHHTIQHLNGLLVHSRNRRRYTTLHRHHRQQNKLKTSDHHYHPWENATVFRVWQSRALCRQMPL